MRRAHLLLPALVSACSLVTDLSGLEGSDAAGDVVADSSQVADVVDAASEPTQEAAAPFDANTYPNLELWVSADIGASGDAGNVTAWTDRSAKQRAVVNPTNDSNCPDPPTLVPNAQHGLPMVKFDGALQCLTVSGAFTDFTAGLTAFAVIEPGNCNSSFTGNAGAVFDSWNSTSTSYKAGIMIGRDYGASANTATGDGALVSTTSGGTGEVQIVGGGSWVPATPHMLTFRLPAAPGDQLVSGTAFVDGNLATLGTNNPISPDYDSSRTTTYIGYRGAQSSGYHLYCGMLGELLVYSKALSDADRQAVESYLKTRWGL